MWYADCPECSVRFEGRKGKVFCSTLCGNRARNRRHHSKHKNTPKWKERVRKQNKARRETPEGKYEGHRQGAKQRGIPFNLSFEEWLSYWEPYLNLSDGVKYCMCRMGDTGPYEVGNVRIDTAKGNNIEAGVHRRKIYTFIHTNGETVQMTKAQFCETYNIKPKTVERAIERGTKLRVGWRVV